MLFPNDDVQIFPFFRNVQKLFLALWEMSLVENKSNFSLFVYCVHSLYEFKVLSKVKVQRENVYLISCARSRLERHCSDIYVMKK